MWQHVLTAECWWEAIVLKAWLLCLVLAFWRTLFQESYGLFRYFVNLRCAAMLFLDRRGFLLVIISNKPFFISWTLTFKMLSEVCSVRCSSWVFCCLSEYYTDWCRDEFAGISTPGKTSNSYQCFPLGNNLPYCTIIDFRLFGNGHVNLSRLMGSNNCFFKITTTGILP